MKCASHSSIITQNHWLCTIAVQIQPYLRMSRQLMEQLWSKDVLDMTFVFKYLTIN